MFFLEQFVLVILSQVIEGLVTQYVKYEIQRKFDMIGNSISQIVAVFDDDGDGVTDREEVMCTFDVSIPDLSNGYCIVNQDDEIGIGLPELELVDSFEVSEILDGSITGNGNGYYIGDDVYIPLDFDFNSDGLPDWGRVVDNDSNGVPDASSDSPFYPVGSDEYNQIVDSINSSGKSLVVVSPDGTVCVYDENGQITDEDCELAYNIWVSDNNIMTKPLDYYTPTEGLLFLTFIVSLFGFFGSIFRRRKVM